MTILREIFLLLQAIFWGVIFGLVALYDAVREHAKKHRLGDDYEGPAADR